VVVLIVVIVIIVVTTITWLLFQTLHFPCDWECCADQVPLEGRKGHWSIAFLKAEGMTIKTMMAMMKKLENGDDAA